MSSPHEHIEHAEHAEHASQPFDKRVAVSVAIVAAVLAGISMLGHRKHNEVLQLQGDANRLTTDASIIQTKANIDHTHATDQWGFYQAKNIRQQMYTANLGLMDVAARDPAKGQAAEGLRKQMQGQVDKYKLELPAMMEDAKKLTENGETKQKDALKQQADAKVKLAASHHAHRQADRLDYGHLGAELGIVLCSLALLTKKKVFWFVGLGSTVLALALVVSAFTLPHDAHDAHGEADTSTHH